MGHEIEIAALSRGHKIVATFNDDKEWSEKEIPECDVVIDFSTPRTAPIIVNKCFDLDLPIVSGTTGWNEQLITAKNRAAYESKSFFYASNFSIGVNVFFSINSKLAALLCPLNSYEGSIEEIHHIHKLDAPSGTAISLAEGIIDQCKKHEAWSMDEKDKNKINITSHRVGEVPGTHLVKWNSEFDTIELKHIAHNRKGFALGAILAAEWLPGHKGSFNMADLLA